MAKTRITFVKKAKKRLATAEKELTNNAFNLGHYADSNEGHARPIPAKSAR